MARMCKGWVLTASLAFGMAQSIPPDEIHSRTVTYTPPSQVTLRTEVRIVEIPAVVRDSRLHAVGGLTRDDFEVYDNGKKQAITAFSVQNFTPHVEGAAAAPPVKVITLPRFLALCFDDLHLLPGALVPVKAAAERFVRTSLAPGDQVVVIRTSKSEDVKFSSDVPTLLDQISKIAPFSRMVSENTERCPAHFDSHEAYQLAEHVDPGDRVLHAKIAECVACYGQGTGCESQVMSAAKMVWARTRSRTESSLGVIDSLVDGMAKLPGQRIILLTSGGFLTGTLETDVERLMEKARHAEVVINGLDARGLYQNTSAGMAYDGMGVLASGTGGSFFHNNNDMELGFRELGMMPETSYLLGFAPAGDTDGRFHKLKVRLTSSNGYSVEARLGYNSRSPGAAESSTPASKFDGEVMASDTITDLPASFTWEQWAGPPGITMILHLDIGRLHFKPNQDRRAQKLTIIAVLLDQRGSIVAGKRSELQLNFKNPTYERLAKSGFTTAMTIQAPAGNYSVRAVAQDATENKLAAASGVVEVK